MRNRLRPDVSLPEHDASAAQPVPVPHGLRFTVGTLAYRALERAPRAWVAVNGRRRSLGTELRHDTELVIDGYPGSANSFIRAWIHFANSDTRIASHQHAGAVIAEAMRRGLPLLVPYRDPIDAAASTMARFPETRRAPAYGPAAMLRWYVRLHQPVLRSPERAVLVSFEHATRGGLPAAVAGLRDRFGINLDVLDDEHVGEVHEYLRTKDETDEGRASVPSEARTSAIERFRDQLLDPRVARLRELAAGLHEQLRQLEEAPAA